jgi:hypothetical protein
VRVREMLGRRGLLSRFHVKSFSVEILAAAHRVLGTDVDG